MFKIRTMMMKVALCLSCFNSPFMLELFVLVRLQRMVIMTHKKQTGVNPPPTLDIF